MDNSAGVNCSDVEVNIKIALAAAMRSGKLKRPARNKLLVSMTDDVGTGFAQQLSATAGAFAQ
ncbi:NAD-glutamate dehydrogenase domain-containing protein [Brucella abortus]|nr:NAD-glutamate dehydrogenase domain-containing protein [Brucella abortus]